jgi:hypothetical protein
MSDHTSGTFVFGATFLAIPGHELGPHRLACRELMQHALRPLFRIAAILILAGLATSLFSLPARAQALPTCQDWGVISKWNVTLNYSGSGSSTDQFGNDYLISENGTISGQITIAAPPSSQCPPILDGSGKAVGGSSEQYGGASPQIQYAINMNNVTHTTCQDTKVSSVAHPYEIDYTMNAVNSAFGSLSVLFDFSDPSSPPQLKLGFYQEADGQVITFKPDPSCSQTPGTATQSAPFGPTSVPSTNTNFQAAGLLPTTVGGFSGSQSYSGGSYWSSGGQSISWTLNWTFTPVPPNLDLVVTIPDYPTWRPAGGQTETDTGVDPDTGSSLLDIEAQLIDKDTGLAATVTPEKVTFVLADVSREPGVVLNWPISGTSDPDLTFQCLPDPFGTAHCQPTSDKTEADFTPDQSVLTTGFLITLVPHDWGGWGTLNVTAMVGGTPVKGHLQLAPPAVSDPNATDILLPQRQPGSFIADNWKNSHNIPLSTSDSDDQEDSPNGNSDYKGDGLTLYEEYRGFYVPACPGCPQLIHHEGDPTKKDLFVINLDRASRPDISDGVRLFQGATGLNVCCRSLTVSQITPDRIINFNHADGPHEVDQHAILITQGLSGTNGCTSTTTFMPGPPKVVNRIFIPPFGDFINHVTNYRQHGLVVSPAMTELQSMVAHELGHASSIWHHGGEPADYHVHWYSPDGTTIKEIPKGTGESAVLTYVTTDAGSAIRVFTEGGTGTAPKQLHAGDLGLGQNVAQRFVQGAFNGTHGGDVMCIMRYDTSMNYVAQADATKRYYAGELTGTSLTNTVDGTGTNQSSRKPQSRYGSAQSSPQRGDCSTQLCINDYVTPQPRGVPGTDDPCVAEQNASQP